VPHPSVEPKTGDPAARALLGGCALAGILLGLALRLTCLLDPGKAFFDAHIYTAYVETLAITGLAGFPELVADFLRFQASAPGAVAPPTRALFITCGHLLATLGGLAPLDALRSVAWFFNLATLPVAFLFLRRAAGAPSALVATALLSVLPTQLFMARGALIDGFFAFWALCNLWCLWENLQRPRCLPLLLLQTLLGALLVLTKENSFFVFATLGALLAACRWLRFGIVTRELWASLILAGVVGVCGIVLLSGGFDRAFEVYRLLVAKAYTLEFAIRTGDGPWFRYPYDLLAVNPATTLLAIGALFGLRRDNRALWFLTLFVLVSMSVMTCVRFGMNLRYGNMWDAPLCALAATQLLRLGTAAPTRLRAPVVAAVFAACLATSVAISQRLVLHHNIGELVAEVYLPAFDILKPSTHTRGAPPSSPSVGNPP